MDRKNILIVIIVVIIIAAMGIYGLTNLSYDENTIKIGYMPSDHHAALFIADAQGQFKKQGLEVELIQFNNGGDLMVAIASGDLDIGYVGITPALSSISNGVPAKVVSSVQSEGSGIVVDSSSDINSIADLKGKNIATPGESSIQYLLLLYALEKEGLSKDDLSISAMKVVSMMDALKTHNIDGMSVYEPFVTMPVEQGIGKEIASSHDILPGHPCCVIIAREDFINKKSGELDKILAIHENATNFINENPDEAAALLPADIFEDPEVEKKAMSTITFTSGLDDAYINKVLDFMKIEIDMGFLKEALTKNQIFSQSS